MAGRGRVEGGTGSVWARAGRIFWSRGRAPWVGAVLLVLTACENRECEASRLQLAQTWETLRDTATSRKQIPEGANLSKAEEETRIRVWTDIEKEAELARSSFETPQVTLSSAEKARADIAQLFKPLEKNEDPMTRGFAVTLNEADQRLQRFRQSCR
jgi:hypothetical protein